MARVTVVIEDVLGGSLDGSISVRYEYAPELDLRGTLEEAVARLTPAQHLALGLKSRVQESHALLGQEIVRHEPHE